MHELKKHIAVICNYQLKDNRIGSMDRFFVAFDAACKETGYIIDWFFPKSKHITFYKSLTVYSDNDTPIETLFLKHLQGESIVYDVVITHFMELFTPFYKTVKQHNGCKIIAVDHMSRPLDGFSLKKRIKNRLKYHLHKTSIDKIIAVSNYIKVQNLRDYSPKLRNKTEVIYNGIPTELYFKRSNDKKNETSGFKFVVVAHLVYEKGIQDLIVALSRFSKEKRANLHVDIYGEGIYKPELKKLVHYFELKQHIHFKGSVSDLYKRYAAYDYMILPTYMEAFNLAILESLAANVPVITTQVGGNPEIIEHGKNGFIFPAKDIKGLANIIDAVLSGKKEIKNPVHHLIEERFTVETMVSNYMNFINLNL